MCADAEGRPRGQQYFTPGNFKTDAIVHPSHGRPCGHRPSVRYRPHDNPTGQWLGVYIPMDSAEFVLLRPTFIKSEVQNLSVEPGQRGFASLEEVLSRTILLRRADVMVPVEDTTTDAPPFVPWENWVGLKEHHQNPSGVVVSSSRINSSMASDYFREGTLGEAHIGVTILDVFFGDLDTNMSHDRWPIFECWFPGGRSL
jgi:hypothetical protein